jgi:hypothetical protein
MQGCFSVSNINKVEEYMYLNKIFGHRPSPFKTLEIESVVYRDESINIEGEDLKSKRIVFKSKDVILYIVYNEFDGSVSVWFHYPTTDLFDDKPRFAFKSVDNFKVSIEQGGLIIKSNIFEMNLLEKLDNGDNFKWPSADISSE